MHIHLVVEVEARGDLGLLGQRGYLDLVESLYRHRQNRNCLFDVLLQIEDQVVPVLELELSVTAGDGCLKMEAQFAQKPFFLFDEIVFDFSAEMNVSFKQASHLCVVVSQGFLQPVD